MCSRLKDKSYAEESQRGSAQTPSATTGRLWVKEPTLEPQQGKDQCVCLNSEVLVS